MATLEVPTAPGQESKTGIDTMTEKYLPVVDNFIKVLVERLQNPNKTLFGKPSPVGLTDKVYKQCLDQVEEATRPVILLRDRFGKLPEQYVTLESIVKPKFDKPVSTNYSDDKLNFFDKVLRMFKIVTGKSTEKTVDSCKTYVRLVNLFSSTPTKLEDKIDFESIIAGLTELLKPYTRSAEGKSFTRGVLSTVSGEDYNRRIGSKVSGITAPLSGFSKAALNIAQSESKPGGIRRKTYRRKKAQRKSRKVRRV